jgi:Fur family ferric uptake transcriptional regulator
MQREKEQFLSWLRGRGHRVTAERIKLLEEIYTHHRHLDAEAVLESMKKKGLKISRATVYRNLDLLVECGLVRKQRLGANRFLYEHVHPGQWHDHLVCRSCGRVVEFVSAGIAAMQAEICRAHGFDPQQYSLQILSLCVECSEALKQSGKSSPSLAFDAQGRGGGPLRKIP